MRIIGGAAGGKRIASPKGTRVRPTPDMIREALFNILQNVEGTSFIDLFAGTGSVGLEALSRGAARVLFVEKNVRTALQITQTLKTLNFDDRAEVFVGDVRTGISRLAGKGEESDVVFADPPYEQDYISRTIQYCLGGGIMADGGMMVLQHSIREPLGLHSPHDRLTLLREKRYGDTVLSFLRYLSKEH